MCRRTRPISPSLATGRVGTVLQQVWKIHRNGGVIDCASKSCAPAGGRRARQRRGCDALVATCIRGASPRGSRDAAGETRDEASRIHVATGRRSHTLATTPRASLYPPALSPFWTRNKSHHRNGRRHFPASSVASGFSSGREAARAGDPDPRASPCIRRSRRPSPWRDLHRCRSRSSPRGMRQAARARREFGGGDGIRAGECGVRLVAAPFLDEHGKRKVAPACMPAPLR